MDQRKHERHPTAVGTAAQHGAQVFKPTASQTAVQYGVLQVCHPTAAGTAARN